MIPDKYKIDKKQEKQNSQANHLMCGSIRPLAHGHIIALAH